MSGVWMEVRTTKLCTPCLARGREEYLKNLIIDEGPLSSLIARCFVCFAAQTKAAAVGNELRAQLLNAKKRATTRRFTWMTIGALVAFGAIILAATALAALK